MIDFATTFFLKNDLGEIFQTFQISHLEAEILSVCNNMNKHEKEKKENMKIP